MFSAARDPFLAQGIVECARQSHHLLDRFAVAATAQGVVRFIVEGNVEHRTEIEIETEEPEQASGDLAVAPNECEVVLVAQLLRVWRFVANQTQARDAATFLINRHNRLDFAQVTQVVDQFFELDRTGDVAAEEDIAAGLDAPEKRSRSSIQFRSRHAREEKLSQLILLHGAELRRGRATFQIALCATFAAP